MNGLPQGVCEFRLYRARFGTRSKSGERLFWHNHTAIVMKQLEVDPVQLPSLRSLIWTAILSVALAPGVSPAAPGGGGGGGDGGSSIRERASRSPEQDAERSYKRGLRERNSAWKHEKKAREASSEKKRKREESRAKKEWLEAVKHYRKAISKNRKYAEAHSSLGYALRNLGDYSGSLNAYDRALQLKPGYPEAIEYRAEAYLALGRLNDAARSYEKLYRSDPEKAQQLLSAMSDWLEEQEREGAETVVVTQRSVEWLRVFVDMRDAAGQGKEGQGAAKANW